MKAVGIFYFSGTGNTEHVAFMIRHEFADRGYQVDLYRMEDILNQQLKISYDEYDLIGIGAQVIGYGAPPLLTQFVKCMPKAQGIKTFIFRTAGGVAPINYNASNDIIKQLKHKGYQVDYERLFSIGSNWIVKFDDDVMRSLYQATQLKVKQMCQELMDGKSRHLESNLILKVLMTIGIPFFAFLLRIIGKDLSVNSDCNHCGICIHNCPSQNIYQKSNKVKFKFKCNNCLRCVYACPQKAIQYRLFKFFVIPSGYNIDHILSETPQPLESEISKPPFYTAYIENDDL